ncbi:hypothetical protein ACQ4PT_040090 [Festuca glaucescens]
MSLIDGMSKVTEMVQLYEHKQCISITVVRANSPLGANINMPSTEAQVPIAEIGEPVVYSVDHEGVLFNSQESKINSDYLYMCTQQSNNNNLEKGKQLIVLEDEGPVTENMANADCYGVYSNEEMAEVSESEEQGEEDSDADNDDDKGEDNDGKNQRMSGLKRKKVESMRHCEGDIDVEDLYPVEDTDSDECIPICTFKKLPVKRRPTSRSHCSSANKCKPDYVPSSDDNFADGDDSDDENRGAGEGSSAAAASAASACAPPPVARPASSAPTPVARPDQAAANAPGPTQALARLAQPPAKVLLPLASEEMDTITIIKALLRASADIVEISARCGMRILAHMRLNDAAGQALRDVVEGNVITSRRPGIAME